MLPIEAKLRDARGLRQRQIFAWVYRCFGAACADNKVERAARLLEEACELAQACGLPEDKASHILRKVWSKPPGEIRQEVGGVSTTLLALCQQHGINADTCEREELERVLALPVEHFVQRQAQKAAEGMVMEEAA